MIRKLRRRVLPPWRFLIPVTALAVLLSCYTAVVLQASDGDLDPTFGDAGKVTIDFGDNDRVRAVAIQPDGKIVTVGTSARSALLVARTYPGGLQDRTFGTSGRVRTIFPRLRYQKGRALLLQPDGKIVVAGSTFRVRSLASGTS